MAHGLVHFRPILATNNQHILLLFILDVYPKNLIKYANIVKLASIYYNWQLEKNIG